MFCKFCKRPNHNIYNCYHRKHRFSSKAKPSNHRKRGKTLFKTDRNIKTEPTKLIADSNSAELIKDIADSNSADVIKPIADSNSAEIIKNIADSNSVDIIEQNDDSNSSENELIKGIKSPATNAEESGNRVNPINKPSISKCKMCKNFEHKIKKLKQQVKDLRAENLSLNLLYFSAENTKFFDDFPTKNKQ